MTLWVSIAACSPTRRLPAAERTAHDSAAVARRVRDSVYVADVRHTDFRRGAAVRMETPAGPLLVQTDTVVRQERRVEYRYRTLHDTLFRTRTDSVRVPVAVPCRDSRGTPPMATAVAVVAAAIGLLLARRRSC